MRIFPRDLFYGWRIVAAGGVINLMLSGFLTHSFGSYFAMLSEERGWSKTALSGAAIMQPLEAALLGPVLGWMIDRFGPQRLIRAGVLMFGAGFMLLSQVQTLLQLYLAFLVIAVGASCGGHFPLNVVIIHWFEKYRARALSASALGNAAGGIVVPMVAWAMHTYGWRPTAFASGVIFIVVSWPLAGMMRSRPEDHGCTVDGLPAAAVAAADKDAAPRERTDYTAREALRTPAFWLISLGHTSALFAVCAVNVHAITHIKESLGYPVTQAALFFTLMLAFQLAGILIGSAVGDRHDKRYIAAVCMLAHMVGLLLLAYASGPVMVIAWAALHGTAWGLRGPFMVAMRADYFGRRSIGMIIGLSSMIVVIGQIAGPMVSGVMADLTGNYRAGFTVLAILAGAGSVFFMSLKRLHESRGAAH